MQNITILLEHVDLLDTGDRLDCELLQRRLQFPVVPLRSGDGFFDDFSARGTFAACIASVARG